MQRLPVAFIRLADVNAHQRALAFKFFVCHGTLRTPTTRLESAEKRSTLKWTFRTCLPAGFQQRTTKVPRLRLPPRKLSREAIPRLPAFSQSPIQSWKK